MRSGAHIEGPLFLPLISGVQRRLPPELSGAFVDQSANAGFRQGGCGVIFLGAEAIYKAVRHAAVFLAVETCGCVGRWISVYDQDCCGHRRPTRVSPRMAYSAHQRSGLMSRTCDRASSRRDTRQIDDAMYAKPGDGHADDHANQRSHHTHATAIPWQRRRAKVVPDRVRVDRGDADRGLGRPGEQVAGPSWLGLCASFNQRLLALDCEDISVMRNVRFDDRLGQSPRHVKEPMAAIAAWNAELQATLPATKGISHIRFSMLLQ